MKANSSSLIFSLAAMFAIGCSGIVGVEEGSQESSELQTGERIIVKYKTIPGLSVAQARANVERAEKLRLKAEISGIHALVYQVDPDDTASEVVNRLNATHSEKLEYAEVDSPAFPAGIPNDPLYANEWHLPKIETPTAWDLTTGAGVTIAILDTGTNCAHPDLAPNCVPGWNTANNTSDTSDINGHGTLTAGTAASKGNNALGGTGVAYDSKIMPVRIATDSAGSTTCSAIAGGITYAIDHGAKVASNSYYISGCSTATDAANYMASKGGLYVRAMGNDSALINTANDANIIHVSATDSNDVKTSWSNYGPQVDMAAPGTPIYCTTSTGGYANCWGTSFSVPIVSGVLALMYSANPNLTADQAKSILFTTAKDLGTTGWDQQYGYGLVNAARAVALAKSTTGGNVADTTPPSTPTQLAVSAVTSNSVSLSWSPSVDNVLVTQYRVRRNGLVVATTSGTNFTDSSLSAQTTYSYSVSARDAAGNESATSTSVSATTLETPFGIASTSVTSKTNSTAAISVTTTAPASVTVKYGTSSNSLTQSAVGSVVATSQTVTLTGLQRQTKYFYQVVATSQTGTTATSAVFNFRTTR